MKYISPLVRDAIAGRKYYEELEDDFAYYNEEFFYTREQTIKELEKATTYDMSKVEEDIDFRSFYNKVRDHVYNEKGDFTANQKFIFDMCVVGNCTYAEAGRRIGITTERARQIESKVLRKLRHPLRGFHVADNELLLD